MVRDQTLVRSSISALAVWHVKIDRVVVNTDFMASVTANQLVIEQESDFKGRGTRHGSLQNKVGTLNHLDGFKGPEKDWRLCEKKTMKLAGGGQALVSLVILIHTVLHHVLILHART